MSRLQQERTKVQGQDDEEQHPGKGQIEVSYGSMADDKRSTDGTQMKTAKSESVSVL